MDFRIVFGFVSLASVVLICQVNSHPLDYTKPSQDIFHKTPRSSSSSDIVIPPKSKPEKYPTIITMATDAHKSAENSETDNDVVMQVKWGLNYKEYAATGLQNVGYKPANSWGNDLEGFQRDDPTVIKEDDNIDYRRSAIFCAGLSDGLYADPEDCSGFYSCWGDGKHSAKNSCGSDFIFNPYIKFCDWPSYYKCPKSMKRPKPVSIPEASKEKEFTCKGRPDGKYADPKDCMIYYTCRGNGIFRHFCGHDLIYNPNIQTCDWPAMYDCPVGNSKFDNKDELHSKISDSMLYFKGKKSPHQKGPTTPTLPNSAKTTQLPSDLSIKDEDHVDVTDGEGSGDNASPGFSCEGLTDGLYADPLHASNFYSCYGDGHYVSKHSCGRDLMFDPDNLICYMPSHNQLSSSSSVSILYWWSSSSY